MGSCCVKQELTEEDIHFLKKHTRYDEETIREWYAGFLQVKCNGFEQKYKAVRTRTRKIFFLCRKHWRIAGDKAWKWSKLHIFIQQI